jgi:Reverse transcriptase (RNA-dependent DNA polymerase)
MRTTDTILGLMHERGIKGLPLERVQRLLYTPDLYLTAYGKLYRNKGAMTEGVTEEAVEGMSQEKIEQTIKALRDGTFHQNTLTDFDQSAAVTQPSETSRSGTPQGGVVSPLLANIYLNRLDAYIEQELIPEYTGGKERKANPVYQKLIRESYCLREEGRVEEAKLLKQQAQKLPSQDPEDPDFRRLKYVRYADDFLLGCIGPKSEAEEIKRKLEVFLREQLKLELSQAKTLITHARTETARFLGYEIHVLHNDREHTKGRRSVNAQIGLRVPKDVIDQKCQDYTEEGKPIHRPELLKDTVLTIVSTYSASTVVSQKDVRCIMFAL